MSAEIKQEVEQPVKEQTKTPEYNFAQVRRAMEEKEAENARLKAELEETKSAKAKASAAVDEDDDEPYVDMRKLKKALASMHGEVDAKIDVRAEQKAREMLEMEKRKEFLRANPDFEEVLSAQNLEKYAHANPDEAEDWVKLPDDFTRKKLIYRQLKKDAIAKQQQEKSSIQQKIDANRKSPFMPSQYGNPPGANMGDFSEAGQKNAFAQMRALQQRAKGVLR